MEITDVRCKDGKRHAWGPTEKNYFDVFGRRSTRWCSKCGSVTQYTGSPSTKREWTRIKHGKRYNINIPTMLQEVN